MPAVLTRLLTGRRGNPPSGPVTVVLASTGPPFCREAVRAAARAAAGGQVAVVVIARLHGFALGMPNPGLMPTARERAAQARVVSDAAAELDRLGVPNDGQIVLTRNPASSIARVARRRGARLVALQTHRQGRVRAVIEGSPARTLGRRMRDGCAVATWLS